MAEKIIEEKKEEEKTDDLGVVQDKFSWAMNLKNPQFAGASKRESILMNSQWGTDTPGPGDRLNRNASRSCRFKLQLYDDSNFSILAINPLENLKQFMQDKSNSLNIIANMMDIESISKILEIFAEKMFQNFTNNQRNEEEQDIVMNASLECLNKYIQSSISCRLLSSTDIMQRVISQRHTSL